MDSGQPANRGLIVWSEQTICMECQAGHTLVRRAPGPIATCIPTGGHQPLLFSAEESESCSTVA
jgi:hypothetical protein